jgi:hypothetical protein
MAFKWLLDSGILDRTHWAIHHSYDALHKTYRPLYTEATAYGIALFLNYSTWSRNNQFLDYAKKLARFVHSSKIRLDDANSAFRFGYDTSTNSWSSKAYSFDTAICISSLLDLSKRTESPELILDATESGYWLVKKMQNKDGSFRAGIDTSSKSFIHVRSWFGDRGCLHGKIIMCLSKLYNYSQNSTFSDSLHSCLKWLLMMQKPSGGITNGQGKSYVFTHSHCYASEALAFAYERLGNEAYLKGLRMSVDWLVKRQNKDGSYYESYGLVVPVVWKRVEATAQACRLLSLMYLIEPKQVYLLAAEKAAKFLLKSQMVNSRNNAIRGGLCSKLLFSLKYPELNSWANLFAIHSLHILQRLKEYNFAEAINELF